MKPQTQAITRWSDDGKTIIVIECACAKDAQIEAEDFAESMSDDLGSYHLIDPHMVRKPNEAGEYVFEVRYFPDEEERDRQTHWMEYRIEQRENDGDERIDADFSF